MTPSLRVQTIRGLKWSYAGTALNAGLQVLVAAITARLLAPDVFGLVAMASVVVRFGNHFSQMGIGSAVVQRPELSNRDVGTATTLAVGLGLACCGLMFAVAPAAQLLFDDADVVPIVRVLSFTFVMGGFAAVPQALHRRELAFRRLAAIEVASYTLGFGATATALAWAGAGVWSLLTGMLCQQAMATCALVLTSRTPICFGLNRASAQRLLAFGGRISVIGFLEFVSGSLDTMVIGRQLGSRVLGMYNRAFLLINLPMQYFTATMNRVLLPSYAQVQADPARLRRAYLICLTVFCCVLFPICAGVSICAGEIVYAVLGPRWAEAITLLRILCWATPFSLTYSLTGVALEATGNLAPRLRMQATYTVLLLAVYVFALGFGSVGIAVASVVAEASRHVAGTLIAIRRLGVSPREIARAHGAGLSLGAAVGVFGGTCMAVIRGLGPPAWLGLLSALAVLGLWYVIFGVATVRWLSRTTIGAELVQTITDVVPAGGLGARVFALAVRRGRMSY